MDTGEQTTGTRDEHYNLVSVLYHALHGAENCNTYALDAEAAGEVELAGFFREAGVEQTQLAERAKEMLGIGSTAAGAVERDPLETEIPPDTAPANLRGSTAPEVGLPEVGASSGTVPEYVSPQPDVSRPEPNVPVDETGASAEEVPPTTDIPRTPSEAPPRTEEVPPSPSEPAPPSDVTDEAPPPGEERPEKRGTAPSTATPREAPPPGEERPERRTP